MIRLRGSRWRKTVARDVPARLTTWMLLRTGRSWIHASHMAVQRQWCWVWVIFSSRSDCRMTQQLHTFLEGQSQLFLWILLWTFCNLLSEVSHPTRSTFPFLYGDWIRNWLLLFLVAKLRIRPFSWHSSRLDRTWRDRIWDQCSLGFPKCWIDVKRSPCTVLWGRKWQEKKKEEKKGNRGSLWRWCDQI